MLLSPDTAEGGNTKADDVKVQDEATSASGKTGKQTLDPLERARAIAKESSGHEPVRDKQTEEGEDSDKTEEQGSSEESEATIAPDSKEGKEVELTEEQGSQETQEEEGKVEQVDKYNLDDKGKPLPFADHPRWKEVLSERNTLKQQNEENKVAVQRDQVFNKYLRDNGITTDQLTMALDFVAKMNTDPAEALKVLQPTYDALASYNGDKIPEDLQKEVDDGALSLARAKEIVKLRAHDKFKETKAQRQQQTSEQEFVQQAKQTIVNWSVSKAKTDLAFKPKTNGEPDGKYEYVDLQFKQLLQTAQIQTLQDVITLAEQAYDSVNKTWSRMRPAKQAIRPLPRSQGTTSIKLNLPKAGDSKRPLAIATAIAEGRMKPGDEVN